MNPQDSVSAPVSSASPQKITGPVELLSSSWKFFRAHWKILVPILILPSAISYVGILLMGTGLPGLAFVSFLLFIIAIILGIAMQPAVISAIQRLTVEPGATLTLKNQYSTGFKYFWSVLFLIVLQIIIMFGSFVLFVIPAIVVSVYGGMYVLALVVDGKKGFAAFTESYSLVKGRWWGVLGRSLFIGLLYVIVALVAAGIVFALDLILGVPAKSQANALISSLVNLVVNGICTPVAVIYIYQIYTSLKNTRMPSVATRVFKNWLIAFICVGVIAMISVPIIGGVLAVNFAKNFVPNQGIYTQGSIDLFNTQIPK